MTPDRGGRLFHAIVGLGLAAGCGGDVAATTHDAGHAHASDAGSPDAARDSGARDAAKETPVADVGVDAGTPGDAMIVDADAARDAAHDVTIPTPPEIK
jgi:hypothetical protein